MKRIGTLRWPCTRLAGAVVVALMVMLAFAGVAAALEQKLVAGDGAAADNLGWSVAVDGDTAVVGVPQENDGQGAVHVFRRSGDRWTETAKLTASDGLGLDNLGWSVALEGDTIVAGAPLDDGPNIEQGSVYTFARSGAATRHQTAKLTASDGATGDNLGWSVALQGDTIVAGAPLDEAGANSDQGSVYTFARSGAATRNQTAELSASDGAATDHLGWSVALEGDTIVAGAHLDDVGANSDQGSAYTFARSGAATRPETAKLTASDGAGVDNLGLSVALQGDTIVAGAPYDDAGANSDQGSVYTFARSGAATRPHTAKLTASDGAGVDNLGWSVALQGDTIVAGAPYDDAGSNSDQGSAYTFARSGAASRTQTAKLTASDGAAADNLGSSVALKGGTILAGAPYDDAGANANQGSASIFFTAAAKPGSAGSGSGGPISGAPGGGKINGTSGDDVINGTAGDDVINCGAGNDVVNGGGGDDVINCGRGNDRVSGGPGDDRIDGESGRDRLSGDTGRDRVFGGGGDDRASGGSGNDRVSGGSGDDRVTGGAGRDRVSGNAGNDRAGGNSGRDRLDGGRGRDRCTGGPGPDRAKRCERRSQI